MAATRSSARRNVPDTRRLIIESLKRDGPQTASALAAALGVTAMAVRQHLYSLHRQEMVTFDSQPVPVGRPRKRWRLTKDSDRCFPDAHAELTVGLIRNIGQAFGEGAMDKLLVARKESVVAIYRQRVPVRGTVRQRLKALAVARSAEGYMAEVHPAGRGAWLLVENHCPICAAATVCQGLCAIELETFREVLGPGVTIERIEHIQTGARRCAYRVTEARRR